MIDDRGLFSRTFTSSTGRPRCPIRQGWSRSYADVLAADGRCDLAILVDDQPASRFDSGPVRGWRKGPKGRLDYWPG